MLYARKRAANAGDAGPHRVPFFGLVEINDDPVFPVGYVLPALVQGMGWWYFEDFHTRIIESLNGLGSVRSQVISDVGVPRRVGLVQSLFGLSSMSSSTTYPAIVPSENVTIIPSSPSKSTVRIVTGEAMGKRLAKTGR